MQSIRNKIEAKRLRKSIQYKHYNTNLVLTTHLAKFKHLTEGSLAVSKVSILTWFVPQIPDEKGYISLQKDYIFSTKKIAPGNIFMFLDVIWIPSKEIHFIRFLCDEKIVGIPFKKGETMKKLDRYFSIPNSGNE